MAGLIVATAAGAEEPGAVNPCPFTAAQVKKALGEQHGEGEVLEPIPGVATRSCRYLGKQGSLRINVTAHSPASAAALRKTLGMAYRGTTPVPGDADGALFQMQADIGTCALHYFRGNVQYEVRLMRCREPADLARAKLLQLPRP